MNGSYLALWLGLWCLTSFATIFSYIVAPGRRDRDRTTDAISAYHH
jgi:hypothetical protein